MYFRNIGLCILILFIGCILLFHKQNNYDDKNTTFTYKMSERFTGKNDSYIITEAEIKDTPREFYEKVKSVNSDGTYDVAKYDVKIKSKHKIDCISPASYNKNTFSCDCPSGFDYQDSYGCISKCPTWKKTNSDGTCTDHCNYFANPYQFWNGSTCTDCPMGFKNDGNNNCIPMNECPMNMKYTKESPHTCVAIITPTPTPFVCKPYEFANSGVCYPKCPIETEVYDTAAGVCKSCNILKPNEASRTRNYINDGSNNCVPSTSCHIGEKIDPVSGLCVPVCAHDWQKYVELETVAGVCSSAKYNCIPKCDSKQYYDDGTSNGTDQAPGPYAECRYCPIGKMSDGNNNCIEIPKTPAPIPQCTAGYQLNSDTNVCESKCDPWRFNDESDPTYCDLICPSIYQFYDLTLGTDPHGHTINNGCADCPVGYIVDDKNTCSLCDAANGYEMKDGKCVAECKAWQTWDKAHNICNYNCPDIRQFYKTGVGCQYCPVGNLTAPDLNNDCRSKNDNCDNERGYFSNGTNTSSGYVDCKFKCGYWQNWDNTLPIPGCVNKCLSGLLYDTSNDMCVTCHDKYPTSNTVFHPETNTCTITSSLIQAAPAAVATTTTTTLPPFVPIVITPKASPPPPPPNVVETALTTPQGDITTQRNNGTISCDAYCAGNGGVSIWNELPDGTGNWAPSQNWKGAKCKSATNTKGNPIACNVASNTPFVSGLPVQKCVCVPNPSTPWAQTVQPTTAFETPAGPITVHQNNGTVTCSRYCGGSGGMSWNNELPDGNGQWHSSQNWGGSVCVGNNCNNPPEPAGTTKQRDCLCGPSSTPWAR